MYIYVNFFKVAQVFFKIFKIFFRGVAVKILPETPYFVPYIYKTIQLRILVTTFA